MPDKISLITGASRGLGRSMAEHLARRGAGVIATYLNDKAAADALVGEIIEHGGRAAALRLDVGRSDSFAEFASRLDHTLRTTFDRDSFDHLINNAGTGLTVPFVETTEQQFDELVRLQLKGPFFLSQTLLTRIADSGRILNVSSGLARFTSPGYSAYATTKGGIEVLTRYMALELAERRIRVNVVVPGAIETDFGGGVVRDNQSVNQMVASTIALGRVGQADDIGSAVAAILSDEFAWANGSRIELSGGQRL